MCASRMTRRPGLHPASRAITLLRPGHHILPPCLDSALRIKTFDILGNAFFRYATEVRGVDAIDRNQLEKCLYHASRYYPIHSGRSLSAYELLNRSRKAVELGLRFPLCIEDDSDGLNLAKC